LCPGRNVRFHTATDLVTQLVECREEKRLQRLQIIYEIVRSGQTKKGYYKRGINFERHWAGFTLSCS